MSKFMRRRVVHHNSTRFASKKSSRVAYAPLLLAPSGILVDKRVHCSPKKRREHKEKKERKKKRIKKRKKKRKKEKSFSFFLKCVL